MDLGYTGLPAASFLGTKGYNITNVDVSVSVVDTRNKENIRTVSPNLEVLLKSTVNSDKLTANTVAVATGFFCCRSHTL